MPRLCARLPPGEAPDHRAFMAPSYLPQAMAPPRWHGVGCSPAGPLRPVRGQPGRCRNRTGPPAPARQKRRRDYRQPASCEKLFRIRSWCLCLHIKGCMAAPWPPSCFCFAYHEIRLIPIRFRFLPFLYFRRGFQHCLRDLTHSFVNFLWDVIRRKFALRRWLCRHCYLPVAFMETPHSFILCFLFLINFFLFA